MKSDQTARLGAGKGFSFFVAFALGAVVLEGVVDIYVVHGYAGSETGLLQMFLPPHELYQRAVLLAIILVCGFVYHRQHAKNSSLRFTAERLNGQLKHESDDLRSSLILMNRYLPLSRTDLNGTITYANEAFCEMTGYTSEELLGKNHRILRHKETPAHVYVGLWQSITAGEVWEHELCNRHKSGSSYWTNSYIHPDYDAQENIVGFTAVRENITDKKKIELLASTDCLTKVFNRAKFNEVIAQRLEEKQRYDVAFSLVLCDIDGFKAINDRFGHGIGDRILQDFAQIVQAQLRSSDFFARWGGEEFAILLPNTTVREAEKTAQKIRLSIENHPFEHVGTMTASFGVSEAAAGETQSVLFEKTDKALYRAKLQGRNRVVVSKA